METARCLSEYESGAQLMRGLLLHDEPMSRHTSWRTGGAADSYYVPADLADLSEFLSMLDESEALLWVGLGSNLLVRDGGIRATVIAGSGVLDELQLLENGISSGSGVSCAKAARYCARNGLHGAEFLAGIPGTIGGALAMNAGAFGTEMWDIVSSVETINRRGETQRRQASDFEVAYRSVALAADEWFVAAELYLEKDEKQEAQSNIRSLLAQRAASQPIGEHSCGSVFRNPPGDYAARLIEASGLKGMSMGGARVSDKHANFIINTGNASAADIENLIAHIQGTVVKNYDIELQPEVRIVGEAL